MTKPFLSNLFLFIRCDLMEFHVKDGLLTEQLTQPIVAQLGIMKTTMNEVTE